MIYPQLFWLALKRRLLFFIIGLYLFIHPWGSDIFALLMFHWAMLSFLIFLLPQYDSGVALKRAEFILYVLILFLGIYLIIFFNNENLFIFKPATIGLVFWVLNLFHTKQNATHYLSVITLSVLVIVGMNGLSLQDIAGFEISIFFGLIMASRLVIVNLARPLPAEFKWRLYFYLSDIEKMLSSLFDCFLQPDYPLHRYLYEKRFHDAKNNAMLASKRLEDCFNTLRERPRANMIDYSQCKQHCDDLLVLITNAGQLRHRVSDHATFRFCADEFNQINKYLITEIGTVQENILKSTEKLSPNHHSVVDEAEATSLLNLEGVYEMVLQVVASEPVNFLLFIQDIKQISRILHRIRGAII